VPIVGQFDGAYFHRVRQLTTTSTRFSAGAGLRFGPAEGRSYLGSIYHAESPKARNASSSVSVQGPRTPPSCSRWPPSRLV